MDPQSRLDGLAIFGLAFLLFMLLNLVKDRGLLELGEPQGIRAASAQEKSPNFINKTTSQNSSPNQVHSLGLSGLNEIMLLDLDPGAIAPAIIPPYAHYFLTQGPHGVDYGHLAIDISAGKDAPILSPIDGWVEKLFMDEWGNPTLVLENDRYQIELLHGIYWVKVGDPLLLGQPVGFESNQGNTVDSAGISCRGRDCGYHTHINVFDKAIGANLNPLDLFPAQQ